MNTPCDDANFLLLVTEINEVTLFTNFQGMDSDYSEVPERKVLKKMSKVNRNVQRTKIGFPLSLH